MPEAAVWATGLVYLFLAAATAVKAKPLAPRPAASPWAAEPPTTEQLRSLHEKMPQIVHDFPFGSPRFIQRAAGYKATICNGQFILRDDELTGTRAGTVLRNTASA